MGDERGKKAQESGRCNYHVSDRELWEARCRRQRYVIAKARNTGGERIKRPRR